jgi:hypothetical protein
VLATLGEIALGEDDLVGAQESFEEAVQLLRAGAPESVNLPFAVEGVGEVLRRRGELGAALEAFQESLRLIRKIGDPAFVSPLEAVAGVLAAFGMSERGARLAGAAERFREESGFRTSIHGRPHLERVEPAWSEGREMTIDQAIEYALRSID